MRGHILLCTLVQRYLVVFDLVVKVVLQEPEGFRMRDSKWELNTVLSMRSCIRSIILLSEALQVWLTTWQYDK